MIHRYVQYDVCSDYDFRQLMALPLPAHVILMVAMNSAPGFMTNAIDQRTIMRGITAISFRLLIIMWKSEPPQVFRIDCCIMFALLFNRLLDGGVFSCATAQDMFSHFAPSSLVNTSEAFKRQLVVICD